MIVLKRRRPPVQSTQVVLGTCVGVAEPLTGNLNDNNQVFNTENEYVSGRISVLYNGQALHSPNDFLESGPNEISLIYIRPKATDTLRATYEYEACDGGGGQMSGSNILYSGITSYTVNFSSDMPDTDYTVQFSLNNMIDSIPSKFVGIVTSKTISGFTVEFSGVIDSTNYVLDWRVESL